MYVDENKAAVVRQNQVPSSTRFCKPLMSVFAKETSELMKRETEAIQEQKIGSKKILYKGKLLHSNYF